jgi:hypothetical protein
MKVLRLIALSILNYFIVSLKISTKSSSKSILFSSKYNFQSIVLFYIKKYTNIYYLIDYSYKTGLILSFYLVILYNYLIFIFLFIKPDRFYKSLKVI